MWWAQGGSGVADSGAGDELVTYTITQYVSQIRGSVPNLPVLCCTSGIGPRHYLPDVLMHQLLVDAGQLGDLLLKGLLVLR